MLVRLAAVMIAAAACQRADIAPPVEAPEISLISPSDGAQVPFDEPFVLAATVIAPRGGSITGVDVVLRGALDDRRRIAASGSLVEISTEISVPSDGHLGPDLVPLELVLTPEALVEGTIRTGIPRAVLVAVVDRTAPELTVAFSSNAQEAPGFDAAFPPGEPFTISLTATDPVGGISRISIDAPASLGGPRVRTVPSLRRASFDVTFEPPANADLRLEVATEDAAETPNRTARTLRIRVGAGGVDELPPEISALDTGPVECAGEAVFGALAEDRSSGIEHVTVRADSFSETAFGPDPRHPLTLAVTATAFVAGPAGDRAAFVVEADDTIGNRSTVSFSREIVDTRPPLLASVAASSFAPGSTLQLVLSGEEQCGAIDRVEIDFGAITATQAIGAAAISGPISVAAPEDLCVLEPVTVEVALIDLAELSSETATLSLSGPDLIPPRIRIIAPPQLGTGAALIEVELSDGQTPVRSATISVSPIDLMLPDPLLSASRTWPSSTCADRVPRLVPLAFTIPATARFTTAAVRISVQVEDASGRVATLIAEIPVIDSVPPLVRFVSPGSGAVLLPGETVAVEIELDELQSDVESLALAASGPVSIDVAGVVTATLAIQAPSAVATFDLLVDPAPTLLGVPVVLDALAFDSSGNAGTASASLSLCGTPAVSTIEPEEGPPTGGIQVEIRGARFAPTAQIRIGGVLLSNPSVESPSLVRATIPPGTYPLGDADVSVTNDCGIASPSATLPAAFRFE